ncbi:MAG: hypothetical protein IJO87_06290 [Eggerthellaceae bacterium]|nr:hypothetical protein [Eggerthellaceae bacterium]
MKNERVFQISLNPTLHEDFNKVVLKHSNFVVRKLHSEEAFKGKLREMNAWDCVCACMDRMRATVEYLNDLEIGSMKGYKNAFDFADFINNASVIIDCVDMLAKIYDIGLSEEDSECRIFNKPGSDGEGSDKKYFEFIRSLCVVHPVETNRHGRYHNSKLAICPYVLWRGNPRIPRFDEEYDLYAKVYESQDSGYGSEVLIRVSEVFDYVTYRYELLGKVAKGVRDYHSSEIDELRHRPIPARGDQESEKDYVLRLRDEDIERFGGSGEYVYDFAIRALEFSPSNCENIDASERYKNAWRLAIEFERKALQSMSREGCENSGMGDDANGWTLFSELEHCRCDNRLFYEFGYELSKLGCLDGSCGRHDSIMGRGALRALKPPLEQYVAYEGARSDGELYMLSSIALYELALDYPGKVNESIPHDLRYRSAHNLKNTEPISV